MTLDDARQHIGAQVSYDGYDPQSGITYGGGGSTAGVIHSVGDRYVRVLYSDRKRATQTDPAALTLAGETS